MGEHESEKAKRGRRTGGGGSAGGGTGTGITGRGSAGGSTLTRVAGGTKGKENPIRGVGIPDVGGGPLPTDTMEGKVTEGPRASKNGAGGESPGEDE
jgi:hypothetical protein